MAERFIGGLEFARLRVELALRGLKDLFDPRCKLTFISRAPHVDDGDLLVTADDLSAVEIAVRRLRARETRRPATAEPWRGPDVAGLTRDELAELRAVAEAPEEQDLEGLAYSVLALLRHLEASDG